MISQTLRGFIRKELIQTLRDPRMKFFLFVTPIIQMTLFGVAISNEVKNIRLVALFPPHDYITRNIYEHALQGGWFIPTNVNGTDPFQMIQSGQADAVLVAPPGGLTFGLARDQAPLQLLADATNATQARAVEMYIHTIVQETIIDVLHLNEPTPPISFDFRVLYNPSLETSMFMVPGVMCLLMVMTTMVLAMNAITREKEMGTFEMLISAPVRPSEVIYGKTIPYIILGMINFPITLSVAVILFGVPMRGSILILAISTFIFVCASVGIGSLISTLCKNQQQANLASFLFMFPAIMFSGLMFPVENMPLLLKGVAYTDPLFHYLALLRNIMLKGGELKFILQHVLMLSVIATIAVFFSFRRFHTTLG